MSALSDLLNSGTVSARQAAEKAAEKGIQLPYGTIAAYWSGRHGRPSATTLKRLAQVVPFTEKELQKAAWNATAPLGPYSPPDEAALLDHRQRLAVDELIRSIVATRGATRELPADSSAPPRAPRKARKDQKTTVNADDLTPPDQVDELAQRRKGGRDFAANPIIEHEGAAYDPPGPTDADEFDDGAGEGPDPDGPEGGA